MPVMWALADPKLGEREVLAAMLEVEADVVASHDRILLITDKGFAGRTSSNCWPATRSRCCAPPAPMKRPATASRCSRRSAS
jgi:hypothetical protein